MDRGEPPPAFRAGDAFGRSVRTVFWLTPGHADQPGVWYAGASPQGLFRTDDGGDTWSPVDGWNDHPNWGTWAEWPDVEGTPDGSMLHSVHRRPARPRPPLPRAVGRWRVRVDRRRHRLAAAQPRAARPTSCPIPTRRSATTRTAFAMHPLHARSAVPAEPLRHLPPRPPRRAVGAHRRQHAARRRRHRVPGRAAPARSRHRVGVPDGRHRRVAAHQPRRSARGVRHARCRRIVDAAGHRAARRAAGSP